MRKELATLLLSLKQCTGSISKIASLLFLQHSTVEFERVGMQVTFVAIQRYKLFAPLPRSLSSSAITLCFSSRIYSGASALGRLGLELELLMTRDRCEWGSAMPAKICRYLYIFVLRQTSLMGRDIVTSCGFAACTLQWHKNKIS